MVQEESDTIKTYLDKIVSDIPLSEKADYADRAFKLAKKTNNDSILYKAIVYKIDYAIVYLYPDSTAYYLDELYKIALKTNRKAYLAYSILKKADYALTQKQYEKAYILYNNSKKIAEKESDSAVVVYNLIKMSEIQQLYNDYVASEQMATEALHILEHSKAPNKEYLIELYNKLGVAYAAMKDYKQAIVFYNKARSHSDDELLQGMIENNIALVYQEKKQYDVAIGMLSRLLGYETVLKDTLLATIIKDNLGFSLFLKDGVSGKELMEEALEIRLRKNNTKGLMYSYLNLSQFYDAKNKPLAADYAKKAYACATEVGAVDLRLQAMELFLKQSQDNGMRSFQEQYFALNDSINNARQSAKTQFAKMKYDASEQRNEYLKMKIVAENNKNTIISVSAILIFIILTLVFLYFLSRAIHKREKQKESYKTETRIAKKLHDELANDVFNTMTFAEVKDLTTPENKEILLDNLDRIYTQTRNISKENNNIDTGLKYLDHLKEMLSGYMSDEVNIIIKEIDSIDWQKIEAAKKIVVYRVLQELLVNMKKHSKATLVLISFKKNNKKIQIDYSDNGVGMGLHGHSIKNGLQNVENRIDSINGTITFDPTPVKGFKLNFSFNH